MLLVQSNTTEKGAALLIVLWVIVLLTLLGTSTAITTVLRRKSIESLYNSVENELIADSAIRLMLRQSMQSETNHFQRTRILTLFDKSLSVSMEDESGRIDLNTAKRNYIEAALISQGWNEMQAKYDVDRIVSWRSKDGTSNGEAEILSKSRNTRGFESIDELGEVLPGRLITSQLRDLFTVYTHLDGPNLDFLPAGILQVVKKHHGEQEPIDASSAKSITSDSEDIKISPGNMYRISACITVEDKFSLCRVLITRPTGNISTPYQVYLWKTISATN